MPKKAREQEGIGGSRGLGSVLSENREPPEATAFFASPFIAPAVTYAKLMIAIAAEAAPTPNRDIRPGRSGFSRDNPFTV
jgi:hypothetical protein